MSLFCFHVDAGACSQPDHAGLDLPDLAAARAWVEAELRSMADPIPPPGFDLMTMG